MAFKTHTPNLILHTHTHTDVYIYMNVLWNVKLLYKHITIISVFSCKSWKRTWSRQK